MIYISENFAVDTLALRPAATALPAGTLYYAWDTAQFFQNCVIDGVNTRGWVQIGGAAPILGSEVVVAPLVDQELVVPLPDVTGFADGTEVLYVFTPTARGSAVGVLTAFAGQTVGPTFTYYRLYEGGTVLLRATPGSLRWDIAGDAVGRPQDLLIQVATTGSDANPGTVAAPVLTMTRAFALVRVGCYRRPKIQVASGTYAQGASPKWQMPEPDGVGAEPLLITGTLIDSGLGALTAAAGGVQGAGSVFGSTVDSVGGFGVNALRGLVQRWTGGTAANLGRSYRVFGNTANTITVDGAYAAAPAAGDTYVLETPGTVFSWTGTFTFEQGNLLGLMNLAFDGGGVGQARLSYCEFAMQTVDFRALGGGGISLAESSGLINLTAATAFTVTVPTVVGPYLQSAVLGCSIQMATPSRISVSRATINGVAHESLQRGTFAQYLDSGFAGNAWVRFAGNTISFSRVRFDAVTPAPVSTALVDAQGAALVVAKLAFASVINTDISNTPAATAPGDAILCADHSEIDLTGTVGAGNAGVGLQVRRHSQLRNNAGGGANTVTGAGGEVKIGANAVVTFAALPANNNDLAAGIASELCSSTTP